QSFMLPRKIGQVVIETGVNRAGNVAQPEFALALAGVGQVEAAVDDQHLARRHGRQRGRIDECGEQGHARPILCSMLRSIAAVAPQMRWPPCTNSTIDRWCPRNSMV